MAQKKTPVLSLLNLDQLAALKALQGAGNVFITGAAGSGKSFLLRSYLSGKKIPVLASTGAAAILVGGRTFHSFFGLGIMEGGIAKTIDRALRNKRLLKRLKKSDCVVIDEISMISGPTLRTAELIARRARGNTSPWGGLRIIAVGDFAQLPPVNPFSMEKEWAFLDEVWETSEFKPTVLRQSMRTSDADYLGALNDVRVGQLSERVREFLNSRVGPAPQGEFTSLFSKRETVERHNLGKLEEISEPIFSFTTKYLGKEKDIEAFRKHSPVGDVLQLKIGALVMLRQNDLDGRWVNGTTGLVRDISDEFLSIEVTSSVGEEKILQVPKTTFTLLNADGDPVVAAENFPVTLAWAMTIHKAQGATLDRMRVDLRQIWEPGQAYVALSRAKESAGLCLEAWSPSAIFADPAVARFHASLSSPC